MTVESDLAVPGQAQDATKSKTAKTQSTVYSGFWWRLATFLVDFPIIFVGSSLLAYVMTKVAHGVGGTVPRWVAMFILVVFAWLYYGLLESSSWRATFGKRLFGMRVTDLQGKRISFGRASTRTAGRILSWALCLSGYLMMIPNKKKQTLHDRLTKTVVLRKVNAAPVLHLFSWMPLYQRALCGQFSTVIVAVGCLSVLALCSRGLAVAMEPQLLAVNAKAGIQQSLVEAKKAQDYVGASVKQSGHFPDRLPDQVVQQIKMPGGSELRYAPQTGYVYIYFSANPYLAGHYVSLAPVTGSSGIIWACSAFSIEPSLVPASCKLR